MALNAKEVAELSLAEIEKKIRDTRHELLELRLRKKTGQLEKSHLLKELRRDVARLETFATSKKKEAVASA
ncbi:50S ribosomal protein L29 [Oceanipulchritudo coccoides]|uniref:50S ribosomal protein L29 n=1 Tax=Oceanipulchritudo coccoides TaxID=2706888 RepID=UPI001EE99A1E|nr:50S ribosomal protein L29 [Oceanipulchritudo coccoides]